MTDTQLFIKYNSKNTLNRVRDGKLDKDLFEGNIKDDHYSIDKYISQKWSFLIFTSLKCNCNCIYCVNKEFHPYYKDNIMSEEIIRQIVRKIGPNIRNASWHGGEPTLVPENLMAALYDEMQKTGIYFATNAQTNGIAFTREKEERLEKLGMHLGLSFDGLFCEEHRGKAAKNAILSILDRLTPRNKYAVINVITNKGIDHLIENYEYFKSLGITDVESELVLNSIGYDNGCVIPSTKTDKLIEFVDYWIHDTNNPIQDRFCQQTISSIVRDGPHVFAKGLAGNILDIDPFGNISLVGKDIRKDWICNIKDIKDYNDIKTNAKYIKAISTQMDIYDHCVEIGCPYKGICIGGNSESNTQTDSLDITYCNTMQKLYSGVIDIIKNIDISRDDLYNPILLDILRHNNYYSLDECKLIEAKYTI